MKTNLVLTGFMGTGKSTVGRLVAQQLERPFVDSDELIVRRAGKSVAAVFAAEGEARFRELERCVCQDLAAQQGLVIATGGGALLDACNRRALERNGLLVCLLAAPETIRARLAQEAGRPLFNQNWEALYRERLSGYGSIPQQLVTDGRRPQEVAQEVVRLWRTFR